MLLQNVCDRADFALTGKQNSTLLALHNKHRKLFTASRQNIKRKTFIHYTINISDSGFVRKELKRI